MDGVRAALIISDPRALPQVPEGGWRHPFWARFGGTQVMGSARLDTGLGTADDAPP